LAKHDEFEAQVNKCNHPLKKTLMQQEVLFLGWKPSLDCVVVLHFKNHNNELAWCYYVRIVIFMVGENLLNCMRVYIFFGFYFLLKSY
jgi:hypothetical protein